MVASRTKQKENGEKEGGNERKRKGGKDGERNGEKEGDTDEGQRVGRGLF